MSTQNIENSLSAVTQALSHLALSLERAGFLENASTYEEMTKVIVGQKYWLAQNENYDYDAQFAEIATVATRIRQNIEPYLDVMTRLQALQALNDSLRTNPHPNLQPAEIKLLQYLQETSKPLSITQLGKAAELPTRTVREMLKRLAEDGWIQMQKSGGRTRYLVSHDKSL